MAKKTSKKIIAKDQSKPLRFVGVSLSGGRSDRACLAVVEYFPKQERFFLTRLYEKIKTDDESSADQKIINIIHQHKNGLELVAFDSPISLPKCISCKLKCPGYEVCQEPELKWFRKFFDKINLKKKPKKFFLPYSQRCVDAYLNYTNEEGVNVHHALGANLAPLTARALYLQKRIDVKCIEIQPHISVVRLGKQLKIAKSQLTSFHHQIGGDEVRKNFLNQIIEKKNIFIYQQDYKSMIENNHAFEAFISSYVAYLDFHHQTETRPEGFPSDEAWVAIPKL